MAWKVIFQADALSPIAKLEDVLDLDRVDIHDSLFDEWYLNAFQPKCMPMRTIPS